MKSLFIDSENETIMTIGREDNNSLAFQIKDKNDYYADFELAIEEALVLQQEINKYLEQIKSAHRSQVPWYKGLGL